jgi:hypothetical protein
MGMKKNRLTLPRLPRLIRARQNLEQELSGLESVY